MFAPPARQLIVAVPDAVPVPTAIRLRTAACGVPKTAIRLRTALGESLFRACYLASQAHYNQRS
jgi:hypothetical protein